MGDNVGDVAGMADVYESYIATVTAAIFLAAILGLPAQYIEMIILFATLALVATFVGVNLLKTCNLNKLSQTLPKILDNPRKPSEGSWQRVERGRV